MKPAKIICAKCGHDGYKNYDFQTIPSQLTMEQLPAYLQRSGEHDIIVVTCPNCGHRIEITARNYRVMLYAYEEHINKLENIIAQMEQLYSEENLKLKISKTAATMDTINNLIQPILKRLHLIDEERGVYWTGTNYKKITSEAKNEN